MTLTTSNKSVKPRPQHVKRFYFLDYFLILLQSCSVSEDKHQIFMNFRAQKNKERLGESKYRKLTVDESNLSELQMKRYQYTFNQVISEAITYELIKSKKKKLGLTSLGAECLALAVQSRRRFYNRMLELMEEKHSAFYHLINLCYRENQTKNGLLIFPIYSPRKLGIEKSGMKTNGDWLRYSKVLKNRLERDVESFVGKHLSLDNEHEKLLSKLYKDKILSPEHLLPFDEANYNSIISRFRKHWLNYFLQKLYNYRYSFDTFNIWVERGKQLGLVHSTEFYPGFDGRLVFPTAIIAKSNSNSDLKKVFDYQNGEKLYAHWPAWNDDEFQETFVDGIVNAYYDIKRNRKTQFIGISDLREKVCYKLRIPSFVFNRFLEEVYNMNVRGNTRIQISLEADRLPDETNALYLKREPILINGEYKNIIAIDFKSQKLVKPRKQSKR